MAKARKIPLPKELTRKQQSRVEREATQQRYLLIGLGGVLAVIVALILFGVFNDRVLEPRQPVAKVGETAITTETFQKRVRYQHLNIINNLNQLDQQRSQFASNPDLSYFLDQIDQQITQLQSQISNPTLVGKDVLDTMVDEALIRQEATRRNLAVPPDEVSKFIEENIFGFYRVPPTPAPTNTPLPTPSVPMTITPEPTFTPAPSPTPISEADYNSAYQNYLTTLSQQAQMVESDFRSLVENELLKRKLQEAFTQETPADVDQIQLRYVLFQSDAATTVGKSLLSGGADFDTLYADVEGGKVVSTTNGEMNWMPLEDLGQQLDQTVVDQLKDLSVGEATSVVTTTFGGAYAFQVMGREMRPLSDSQKESKGQQAFDEWLALKRVEQGLVDYLNDRYVDITPPFVVPQAQ